MTSSRQTPPSRTASLLLRLSREAGAEQTGLLTQEEDLRALAADLGLEVIAVHKDDGLSGALRERPGLRGWLEDARSGRADHLLAWSLDRVTRGGIAALGAFMDVLESSGARFLTVRDRLDSSDDTWEMQAGFGAVIAKRERKATSERIKRSQKRLAAEGRWRGGVVPYGFEAVPNPDGAGKVLAVNAAEAEALRSVLRLLSQGHSWGRAARWLQAHGTPPRRGGTWTTQSVRNALRSETAMSSLWTASERKAIRERLAGKGSRSVPSTKADRLLSTLLRCHSCGAPLYLGNTSRGRQTYRCATSSTKGRKCAQPVTVTADTIEEAVTDLWLSGWGGQEETEVLYEAEGAERLAAIEEAIAEAESDVIRLRGPERVEAMQRQEALEVERDAIAATPVSSVGVLRYTGRTYADSWHAVADAHEAPEGENRHERKSRERRISEERRDLLRATIGVLTIDRAEARGVTGFDAGRIRNPSVFDPAHADAITAADVIGQVSA